MKNNIFHTQDLCFAQTCDALESSAEMEIYMKVVIAIDSFKESMTSMEAGNAVKKGILAAKPDAEVWLSPLADGGEGTVDALIEGLEAEKIPVTAGRKSVVLLRFFRRDKNGCHGNGICRRNHACDKERSIACIYLWSGGDDCRCPETRL